MFDVGCFSFGRVGENFVPIKRIRRNVSTTVLAHQLELLYSSIFDWFLLLHPNHPTHFDLGYISTCLGGLVARSQDDQCIISYCFSHKKCASPIGRPLLPDIQDAPNAQKIDARLEKKPSA